MSAPAVPPRVLVLRAPGTNCDGETAHAFELAGAVAERVHINRLIENPSLAARYQILCFPGGFSYGDDIAAGMILATRLRRHLSDLVHDFAHGNRDALVLGICNGMQIMMRLGILTGDIDTGTTDEGVSESGRPAATLTWNEHGRYEARWVHLAVDPATPCVFLRGVQQMYLPIAHAEGNFVASSDAAFGALAEQGRLAIRYCRANDPASAWNEQALPFPVNPNGAAGNVAGVCDRTGRVFGLMPHPERFIDHTQHPYWTRLPVPADASAPEGQGMTIFRNAVGFFR